jgi:hypothetical protein
VAELIRFETNIPVEMAFTYPTGKEVEGRYGAQYYRGTVDGRAVYLPPIVEEKLCNMDLGKGERVAICKREIKDGRKKAIRWEVNRVDAQGEPGWEELDKEPVKANGAIPQRTAPPAETTQPKPNGTPAQPTTAPIPATPLATIPTKGQTELSRCVAACGVAAIDALMLMKQYADSKGFSFIPREDQVQSLTATLYIQNCKQSNISQMHQNQTQRANGGADPWRQ